MRHGYLEILSIDNVLEMLDFEAKQDRLVDEGSEMGGRRDFFQFDLA